MWQMKNMVKQLKKEPVPRCYDKGHNEVEKRSLKAPTIYSSCTHPFELSHNLGPWHTVNVFIFDKKEKPPLCRHVLQKQFWWLKVVGFWGPLYTMAKGCDHEIVRVLEIHPKVVPWRTKLKFRLSLAFKCSVKRYLIGALNRMLYMWTLLRHNYDENLKCHGLPVLC